MTRRGAFVTGVLVAVALGGAGVTPSDAAAARCSVDTTIAFGARSGDVMCLEAGLTALGYTEIHGPDGSFGVSTRRAVMMFQQAQGLSADGIVGPRTQAALATALAGFSAAPAVPAAILESRVIGTSVQGREIVAYRMGTPGGRVVLIVGIIHGDEVKGAQVTELLKTSPTPGGIDLWLIDTINPDGVANGTRENANQVDLNRNFEVGWSYIPKADDHRQYSGEAPADQPETLAMQRFITEVRPAVGIWYHQDANVITTSGARKVIPLRYGELVGLGSGDVPCSQRCTGTAGKFANTAVPGSTNFLVELPGSDAVTDELLRRHAAAVLAVIVL